MRSICSKWVPLLCLLFCTNAAWCELSARDCETGDWRVIGYQDGRNGLAADAFDGHAAQCQTLGFDADPEAHLLGWNEGIADFCSETNGFDLGAEGKRFRNPCPTPYSAAYRNGFQTGRQVYLAEAEIAELESMVVALSDELKRVTRAQQEAETQLIRGDASPTERYRWLEETKYLARERTQSETEINSLEIEIESRKEHLELLRTSIAGRAGTDTYTTPSGPDKAMAPMLRAEASPAAERQ
jgi:hypothetical protein